MRCQLRQRQRFLRKRFEQGEFVGLLIEFSLLAELQQQAIPFGFEFFTVSTRVHESGRIRQYGQCCRLGPGQIFGRTTEEAPGSSLQANHVSTERCMPGIQSQDGCFGVAAFESEGEHHFPEFLPQVPGGIFVREANHLHAERTGSAHHPAPGDILPDGTGQRKRIHSRMLVKRAVFEAEQGFFVSNRQ